MSPLLDAQGLALVRGGRLLFKGLDLRLEAGQALHIVGPNGSGKSSLIRLIAGLQFLFDVVQMRTHGARAQRQLLRDFRYRKPLRQQHEHLELAIR